MELFLVPKDIRRGPRAALAFEDQDTGTVVTVQIEITNESWIRLRDRGFEHVLQADVLAAVRDAANGETEVEIGITGVLRAGVDSPVSVVLAPDGWTPPA